MPTKPFILSLALPILSLALLACSDSDDDSSNAGTLTAQQQADYCKDVAAARSAINDVKAGVASGDPAQVESATAKARDTIPNLNRWSKELEGGTDLIANLDKDMTQFVNFMAGADIASAGPEIDAQVAAIESDLDELDQAGDCP